MFIFFFCQLSVNEADGLSADADVHLNSEAYGKQAGARGQERGRYGELPRGPAARLPGPVAPPGACASPSAGAWTESVQPERACQFLLRRFVSCALLGKPS